MSTSLIIALLLLPLNAIGQGIDTIRTLIPIVPSTFAFPDSLHGMCMGDHPLTQGGGQRLLILTDDGGNSWKKLYTPFSGSNGSYPSPERLHIYAYPNAFRSTDRGQSWDSVRIEGFKIRFVDDQYGFTEEERTTDSGTSWMKYDWPRPYFPHSRRFSFGYQDPSTGWMFGSEQDGSSEPRSEMWITQDSAASWNLLFSNVGEKFASQALRTKAGRWLLTFENEEVFLSTDSGFKLLGRFGRELAMNSSGAVYASRGYRSIDNGESFQKWIFNEELENGKIAIGSDSLVYFTQPLDTNNWQNVGHIIYRVYSPSLAFRGKSNVIHSAAPVTLSTVSIHRGEPYRLPANNGYDLFNLIGLRVAGSSDPTEFLSTSDLTSGLYLLRLGPETQRVFVY